MVAFDDFDSMLIERYYQKYLKSNGDKAYRYAKIGKYTVDLKKMVMRLTNDKEGSGEEFKVVRGKSHYRPRASDSKKFSERLHNRNAVFNPGMGIVSYLGSDFFGSYKNVNIVDYLGT